MRGLESTWVSPTWVGSEGSAIESRRLQIETSSERNLNECILSAPGERIEAASLVYCGRGSRSDRKSSEIFGSFDMRGVGLGLQMMMIKSNGEVKRETLGDDTEHIYFNTNEN